jgi:deoxyhypusine synthase
MKPIVIITIVFVFLFVPTSVFAEHEYDDYDVNDPALEGKTPIRFYKIFVSQEQYLNECEGEKSAMLHMIIFQLHLVKNV